MKIKKPDYVIEPDDEFGKEIGFTSDLFAGYISKLENTIYISAILSKKSGEGNFSKLIELIKEKGYEIKIPCPLPHMEMICLSKGWKHSIETHDGSGEAIDVYTVV